MESFLEQLMTGLSAGSIYASFALALVATYRSTRVVNFAQGEMAMVCVYIAWSLLQHGYPYWLVFFAVLPVSLLLGMGVQLIVLRPVEDAPKLNLVVITIALLLILRSVAGWMYGYDNLSFPSPFPETSIHLGKVVVAYADLGIIAVNFGLMGAMYAFFNWTSLGLVMRAVAQNPDSAKLLGLNVRLALGFGWGIACMIGTVAGLLVAPTVFLSPTMMSGIMIYALAAAIMGGLDSALGAVVGGLSMGVLENLVGAYVSFIGPSLKLTVALATIIAVLVLKPDGLFGKPVIERV